MQALLYPGRPNLLMDHLQLGLKVAGEDEPRFYLSLYVIPWSREMGAGHVALVRYRQERAHRIDVTLTDNLDLARRQQAILRAGNYQRVDLTDDPRPATFSRNPIHEQDRVRYRIAAAGLEVEAHWDGLGEPVFACGPAPARPEAQEIWSMLFEADAASATVNSTEVPGHPYPMETWTPWLGRSLWSGHVARGEILVDRPEDGGGWTGRALPLR